MGKKLRILKNRAGMSLIEILITLAILSVVSMGIASLITNLYKSQNQASVLQTLTNLKTNFSTLIADGNSWSATVESAANTVLACLKTETGATPINVCTEDSSVFQTPVLPDPIATYRVFNEIRDGAGNPVYANTGGNSTSGFTADGRLCNSFSATTGNDACPIQYHLSVRYDCVLGTTCKQPTVTVFATLRYNPSPNNPMRAVVNTAKYSVMVRRGTGVYTRNELVYVTYEAPGNAPGGGACNPGGWIARTFNTIKKDDGGNIMNTGAVSGAGTTGVLLQRGTYLCDAGAKGFAVGGFTARITINSGNRADLWRSAYTSPSPGTQAEAIISRFQITEPDDFTIGIEQNCSQAPTAPIPATFAMGIPTPVGASDYSQSTVYAFISCVRQF